MKDKRKVVIITIYDPNPNFGNRLQNYAVQTVIENFGFEAISVAFRNLTMEYEIKRRIYRLIGYRLTEYKAFWKMKPQQIEKFKRFNRSYIKTCKISKIKDIPDADFYVLGSDQLWNPQWWNQKHPELEQNIYLATFAQSEKIVCFSPSFGCNRISDEWIQWFSEKLNRISSFSVREEEGRRIINELTGKDALVTIDPTLMLTRNEWDEIARKPFNMKKEKYILTYFLGGKSNSMDDEIDQYAKTVGAKVYSLFDLDSPEWYCVSPEEFIYMIARAELILTDSFHACVFSFIYEKPFLVYDRIGASDMMSRINTFLEKFDLKRKYYNSRLKNDLLECDYSRGYARLKVEQEKLKDFLMMNLSVQKNNMKK